jgi:chemotaxis protein CheX
VNLAEAARLITEATNDVFETMLQTHLVKQDEFEDPTPTQPNEITAVVGLAGERCGCIAIGCEYDLARTFVSRMLGMKPQEIEAASEVRDGLGEIVNMVAGNVKRLLAPVKLELALPMVVTTLGGPKSGGVSIPKQPGFCVRFQDGSQTVCVELSLRET